MECVPGEQKCIGFHSYICTPLGEWALLEYNAPQCQEPPPPECIDGTQKCIGFNSYICSGGKWVILEYNAPECQGLPPPPECTPGTQKCIGYDLWVCSGAGTWVIAERNSPQCVPAPPETFHLSIFVPSWAAGGYVQPSSGDYLANTTITLRAYPLSGYQFTGWGGDASGVALTYNLYMNSDKNVEAYFEKIPVVEYKATIVRKELEYDNVRISI